MVVPPISAVQQVIAGLLVSDQIQMEDRKSRAATTEAEEVFRRGKHKEKITSDPIL